MSAGMTVLPRRLTTRAPAGVLIVPRAPTALMRPCSTTNTASSIGARRSPVSSRAPSNTSAPVGACARASHGATATSAAVSSSLRMGAHGTPRGAGRGVTQAATAYGRGFKRRRQSPVTLPLDMGQLVEEDETNENGEDDEDPRHTSNLRGPRAAAEFGRDKSWRAN